MGKIKTAPVQVQKYLKGIDYPATKQQLIEHAKKNQASDDVISMLEDIKGNKFNDPADVSKGLKDSD
jgi:hypothetical protein